MARVRVISASTAATMTPPTAGGSRKHPAAIPSTSVRATRGRAQRCGAPRSPPESRDVAATPASAWRSRPAGTRSRDLTQLRLVLGRCDPGQRPQLAVRQPTVVERTVDHREVDERSADPQPLADSATLRRRARERPNVRTTARRRASTRRRASRLAHQPHQLALTGGPPRSGRNHGRAQRPILLLRPDTTRSGNSHRQLPTPARRRAAAGLASLVGRPSQQADALSQPP